MAPPHRNPSTSMRLLPMLSIVANSIVRSSGAKAPPYHHSFPTLTIVVRLPVPLSTKSIEVSDDRDPNQVHGGR